MDDDVLGALLSVVFVVVLIIGGGIFQYCSYHWESDSFNRLCNGHTTWWDAAMTELRIDGTCKGAPSHDQ